MSGVSLKKKNQSHSRLKDPSKGHIIALIICFSAKVSVITVDSIRICVTVTYINLFTVSLHFPAHFDMSNVALEIYHMTCNSVTEKIKFLQLGI